MSSIPPGNPMQFPNLNPQLPPQQMQMPGYPPVTNPYGHASFPPSLVNDMPTPPNISPELFRMYMQMHQSGQMTAMGGMAGNFMAPGNPMGPQTPSPGTSDSGNETLSPPVQQQQQMMSTNANCAQVAHGFPNNLASDSAQQTSEKTVSSQPAPMFSMENFLTPSTSETPSVMGKEIKEEKENIPIVAPKMRRPTPYERTSMMFPNPMVPNFMYQQIFKEEFYRREACAVCGDICTGYHYGVMSCEGCKGFFRRSVKDEAYKKYTCNREGRCMMRLEDFTVKRSMRTSCRECRYKKCLAVGMNKDHLRPIEKEVKKEVASASEVSSPALKALILAFETMMPVGKKMTSEAEAALCLKKLLLTVPAFASLVPDTEAETDKLIEKLLPGLLHIRAAFSLDTLQFVGMDQAKVEKLRSGIRCTILNNEGLALLSGVFIFQSTNGNRNEMFQTCISGLRQHFSSTQSQEPGTTERLLTKIGCLQ